MKLKGLTSKIKKKEKKRKRKKKRETNQKNKKRENDVIVSRLPVHCFAYYISVLI